MLFRSLLFCKLRHKRQNWGNLIGFILALFALYIVIYGSTIGFNKVKVNEQEFVSKDLPASFDGYRIVVFSDLHVGSWIWGREKLMDKMVDKIQEQQGDMVMFVGDLQNLQPTLAGTLLLLTSHLLYRISLRYFKHRGVQ